MKFPGEFNVPACREVVFEKLNVPIAMPTQGCAPVLASLGRRGLSLRTRANGGSRSRLSFSGSAEARHIAPVEAPDQIASELKLLIDRAEVLQRGAGT
jgi:hypothetical protein